MCVCVRTVCLRSGRGCDAVGAGLSMHCKAACQKLLFPAISLSPLGHRSQHALHNVSFPSFPHASSVATSPLGFLLSTGSEKTHSIRKIFHTHFSAQMCFINKNTCKYMNYTSLPPGLITNSVHC